MLKKDRFEKIKRINIQYWQIDKQWNRRALIPIGKINVLKQYLSHNSTIYI
jgi:hypothetical protein